jgi:nicotinamide-nucleotide amidase
MIVEVVAVGTELLLGQIVNRNAAAIGATLADHGFDAHHQSVVGDNLERIAATLRTALGRADAVIVTGGIGPTQDDLTREGICAATGLAPAFDEAWAQELRDRFARMGREMPESNLRQAQYPEGAELLANPKGTAPGLALRHVDRWIFALPGVPQEMEWLLQHEVMPRLHAAEGEARVLVSRMLRSWGRSESQTAEMLDDLYTGSTNPTVAFLASSGEIKVRITAKAAGREEAEALIAPIEAEVRRRLGEAVFGADDETIETVVLREARNRGWTVGAAESATGGMVAGRLTSIPGASETFRGGVVAYATDLKAGLLGVPAEMLEAGVVSEETALAMARGARTALGVDAAVAVTGSAGPNPQERPTGTVVVAVVTPDGEGARTFRLPGDRERVRTYAATAALQLLRRGLTGAWWQ